MLDSEGYLQVTDRIKDVIKTGGEWVSSLELEDLVSRHPAVSEVAVISVTDVKWGERPMPLVVLKPDKQADEEQILEHLKGFAARGVISRYAVPDRVVFVGQIDKTSVGKIDKKRLRERFQSAPVDVE
ncbi:acyl-CoA synthetase (AMP-forming)/AMP-acid ligase II [Paraburkholderia sp. MM5477-R1]